MAWTKAQKDRTFVIGPSQGQRGEMLRKYDREDGGWISGRRGAGTLVRGHTHEGMLLGLGRNLTPRNRNRAGWREGSGRALGGRN